MKATIYSNSRCSTCRNTLGILEEKGVEVEIIEYLQEPPTKETLQKLLGMMGIGACELLRKKESLYKKEKYGDHSLSDEECLRAMVENPILIQRPVVVVGDKAVLARPPEKVLELIT